MLVTIAIPCFNEAKFIEKCVESVRKFVLPVGVTIEILVIDGNSTDTTVAIADSLARKDPRIRVIDNPGRIQSCALNIAFREARGERLLRLDAHAIYPESYLKLCIETTARVNADNVGGLFIAQARGDGYQAKLVQAMTTHKFGVGDAGYRTGEREGPADTVPYGFFNTNIVDRVGYFDERLVRGQDYEFNRRILASGGVVWRNPEIQVYYFNQPDLRSFYRKQMRLEGPYNAYIWQVAPYAFTVRHCITALFSAGVLSGLLVTVARQLTAFAVFDGLALAFAIVMALYFLLALVSAGQQALRFRQFWHVLTLPVCFFLYHFLHGLGVLAGIFAVITRLSPIRHTSEPWPGAGRFRAWPAPNSQPTTVTH
jgi:glycosyltransferase involved in cell wall biosynthesis